MLFSTPGQWERKAKRSAINGLIVDNDVDVLCFTETWLLPSGDEAKCYDLLPLATGLSASLVLHVAVASPSLSPIRSLPFCVTADFSFPHSSFELSQLTFFLPQRSLHISCLYRPPPNRKKQLKDSLFVEQFPDLLEYKNSLKGCSLIVGDF